MAETDDGADPDAPRPAEQRLADALVQFCADVEAGLDPDPRACLASYPDEVAGLAECLEGLAALEELRTALAGADEDAPAAPRTLGDYQILREVGRGGMGVVYEARDLRLGRRVALKMIRAGDLAGPEELQRFQAEARAVASLQHPGIVQIYEVGAHEGRPFLALEFVDGLSLDARIREAPLPPRAAALVVQHLAWAVHFAHRQQIIHRDLKPANVLLAVGDQQSKVSQTEEGRGARNADGSLPAMLPKITDFGLAKRLDAAGQTHSGAVLGTPSYMAPEQAAGQTHETSAALDIYALGAILYEALTGRPPFKAATTVETLRQVVHDEPAHPRRLQSHVPADLETICLKCLQKEPARRYVTAQALADDLGRFLSGEPIVARSVGRAGRLWRWCRRNPGVAGLLAAGTLLLTAVAVLIWLREADAATRTAEAQRRRDEILRSNVYAAQGVASTVLLELQHLASAVLATTEDARIRDCLRRRDHEALQRLFHESHDKYAEPARGFIGPSGRPAFHSWHVIDAKGILRADYPRQRVDVVGKDFSNRDYYEGALAHAGATGLAAVHVSRVYQSENDSLYKITLSCRVRADAEPGSATLGVVCATIPATSTLGAVRLADANLKAVLVGRRDPKPPRGPAPAPLPVEYLIVIHPGYEEHPQGNQNIAVPVPEAQLRMIPQPGPGSEFRLPRLLQDFKAQDAMNAAYADPVGELQPEAYGGRWLAGFAPVGNTELLVIVQQRDDAAVPTGSPGLSDGAIAVALCVLLGLAGSLAYLRRPRAAPQPPTPPPSSADAATITQAPS
jgi:serine/threonine-protein kinase